MSRPIGTNICTFLSKLLKEVQRYFREVSKEFQGSLKGVIRKFLGCFNEVSGVFQGRL